MYLVTVSPKMYLLTDRNPQQLNSPLALNTKQEPEVKAAHST